MFNQPGVLVNHSLALNHTAMDPTLLLAASKGHRRTGRAIKINHCIGSRATIEVDDAQAYLGNGTCGPSGQVMNVHKLHVSSLPPRLDFST